MAMPAVTTAETHRITGQQTSHQRGKRCEACSEEQMSMIGQQSPSVTRSAGLVQEIAQSTQEVISVRIVPKYLWALYAPYDNVVQCSRGNQARLTRHISKIPISPIVLNQ
jgi:hypothetical protein